MPPTHAISAATRKGCCTMCLMNWMKADRLLLASYAEQGGGTSLAASFAKRWRSYRFNDSSGEHSWPRQRLVVRLRTSQAWHRHQRSWTTAATASTATRRRGKSTVRLGRKQVEEAPGTRARRGRGRPQRLGVPDSSFTPCARSLNLGNRDGRRPQDILADCIAVSNDSDDASVVFRRGGRHGADRLMSDGIEWRAFSVDSSHAERLELRQELPLHHLYALQQRVPGGSFLGGVDGAIEVVDALQQIR